MVAVLRESVIFLADLVRAMRVDCDVDFLSLSAYSGHNSPSGVVRVIKDTELPLEKRHVVLVEDVVDTGLSLAFLMRTLEERHPKALKVCTLVDKPARRIAQPPIHYWGFRTDEFLVGYGLDFRGLYRNLPFMAGVSNLAALAAEPTALLDLYVQG